MTRAAAIQALLLAALLVLVGCQPVYKYRKMKANPPACEAGPSRARVFFLRGAAVEENSTFPLWADCALVGVTRSESWFCADFPPGRTVFLTRAENVAILEVDLAAGATHYIGTGERLSLGGTRVELREVPVERGEALIADWVYLRAKIAATAPELRECPDVPPAARVAAELLAGETPGAVDPWLGTALPPAESLPARLPAASPPESHPADPTPKDPFD